MQKTVHERELKIMANGSVHGLKFKQTEKLSYCEICGFKMKWKLIHEEQNFANSWKTFEP